MGSLKKRRKEKINKHKRRKRRRENRHKKRLRYKA
ncbi:MAG: AURKAIP1/COX24 domain-containing protein [Verrucomicrobiota bacterium]